MKHTKPFWFLILFVIFLATDPLPLLEATTEDLNEQLKTLALIPPGELTVISPEQVTGILQQAITEKNTKFLVDLLGTRDRLIGRQALNALPSLTKQDQYQFLSLFVQNNSFWRNVNFEHDSDSVMLGKTQEVLAARVSFMIQRDISVQDFYDTGKRQQIQNIVADVLENGLPNRDPNWQPKEWIPDASPKKTMVIEDPVKTQRELAATGFTETNRIVAESASSMTRTKADSEDSSSVLIWTVASVIALAFIVMIARKFL